jgi:hypothetical protein
LGIENIAEKAVQGRAVLIDLHAHFGDTRTVVGYEQLAQVLAADGVVVESGVAANAADNCAVEAYPARRRGIACHASGNT